jgi:hypothetical protein
VARFVQLSRTACAAVSTGQSKFCASEYHGCRTREQLHDGRETFRRNAGRHLQRRGGHGHLSFKALTTGRGTLHHRGGALRERRRHPCGFARHTEGPRSIPGRDLSARSRPRDPLGGLAVLFGLLRAARDCRADLRQAGHGRVHRGLAPLRLQRPRRGCPVRSAAPEDFRPNRSQEDRNLRTQPGRHDRPVDCVTHA